MKLQVQWQPESIERGQDNNVGARLVQLTSGASLANNIYCEERYMASDASRFPFIRFDEASRSSDLWLYDMATGRSSRICTQIDGFPAAPRYRDSIYFCHPGKLSPRTLTRLDLKTLEMEDVFDLAQCPGGHWLIATVSPDERYFVASLRVSSTVWGLYRVDLRDKTWKVFHQQRHILNPHQQFEPAQGKQIMVQHNRGGIVDAAGNIVRLIGPIGATLYLVDPDGRHIQRLPIGKPYTPPVTGHECWVGRTGRIILTTAGGEIHLVVPGERRSRLLWRGLPFGHIATSDDGRYFVVDDFARGRIYIGNVDNGRMLPFCDSGASCGSPQYTHPHAFMTPDNRFVIFNSDRTGSAQVWAAELPPGFLAALDLPV
jgi:hypothetical protein